MALFQDILYGLSMQQNTGQYANAFYSIHCTNFRRFRSNNEYVISDKGRM